MVKKNKLPISTSPVSFKPTREDVARERKYQAEDALRCLQRAAEIKKDKQLVADAKALAREQIAALKKV